MDQDVYRQVMDNLMQIDEMAKAIIYSPNPQHPTAKAAAEIIRQQANIAWKRLYVYQNPAWKEA